VPGSTLIQFFFSFML